jgi:hypothetical protein
MFNYRNATQEQCDEWRRDEVALQRRNARIAATQIETPMDMAAAFNGYDFNVHIIETWDRLTLIDELRRCKDALHEALQELEIEGLRYAMIQDDIEQEMDSLTRQLQAKSNECEAWKNKCALYEGPS